VSYSAWVEQFKAALDGTVATENGTEVGVERGFSALVERTRQVDADRSTVYLIGNGASASMASHFAIDLWKNCGIRARTFQEAAQLTAISNDIGFEDVFAIPIGFFGNASDALLAISSSGNSPNCMRAAEKARELGMWVASLTGFSSDNGLRALSDLAFYVPARTYGMVESCHAVLMHHWIDTLGSPHA
jgi:D-sedoheptulose 7-phosphate isomerase